MESKVKYLAVAALAVSFLAVSMADTNKYSAIAQSPETTVSMAEGSQAPDNPEFYVPPEVAVEAGENVTWTNDDTAIHTATSGKDTTPDGIFDTSLVSPGQSKSVVMPREEGEYPYFCTLHPWMTGTVTVS